MGIPAPSIALVTQSTRVDALKGRWATLGAARFRMKRAMASQLEDFSESMLCEHDDALAAADFTEYEDEDTQYQNALRRLQSELKLGHPVHIVERHLVPNYPFGFCVCVVVLGRDGLVANTAKYATGGSAFDEVVPVVGVNPDPHRIDGPLLPFTVETARRAVRQVLNKRETTRETTLAECRFNDGQRMLAFNDFFVGTASHVSARYTIRTAERSEPQTSSGVIVSTGAGSTGWLSSVFNMAQGVAQWMGAEVPKRLDMTWEDRQLIWAVREPFADKQSSTELVAGLLPEGESLFIESLMPTGGVVFSDGIESDFLEFNSGTVAEIVVSDQRVRLVVPG